MGRKPKKEWIYVYVWLINFAHSRKKRKALGEDRLRPSFTERWRNDHSGVPGLKEVLDLLRLFCKETESQT